MKRLTLLLILDTRCAYQFRNRYLHRPQHIEVQVLSDGHGNHIHLYERDCSLQRKHQKIIETAPAMGISDAVRTSLTTAAVRLAQSLNYGMLCTAFCPFTTVVADVRRQRMREPSNFLSKVTVSIS